MKLLRVDDAHDARLADFERLTDVSLRLRAEPAHGLFIAESRLVIERAIAAGYRLRAVLVAENLLPSIEGLVGDDVPVFVGSPEVLRAVTGFHVHRGALASVDRLPLRAVEEIVRGARRVVVLEDVNTHTNLGAIFRAVAAFGVDAVLLSPSCTDPLYRRAVRVSMGAVFAVPYARFTHWPEGLDMLRTNGFRVLGLHPGGHTPLDGVEVVEGAKVALVLGSEGLGLSATALSYAEPVRIPMSAGVDSLNVAAAAAVACYALR